MSSRDTRNLIIDVGESLFSRHSYVDVTFRQIAKRAGVHISQITYHFKNKDRLLEQVVYRRATVLNDERMSMLTAYRRVVGREGWDPLALPVFNEAYNEVARHYLVALTKAAPEIEEEHIHRAFQFLLATMYCAGANNRRIDNLSSGKFSSQDFDRIYESIIPFVTGGFKALAKASIVSHLRGDAA